MTESMPRVRLACYGNGLGIALFTLPPVQGRTPQISRNLPDRVTNTGQQSNRFPLELQRKFPPLRDRHEASLLQLRYQKSLHFFQVSSKVVSMK
jgi:hypothetical protein